MNEPAPPSVTSLPERPADRLDSWKDIATYLKRDVSTVQRWEKREHMPVHRHLHDRLGSVYAFRAELDAWSQSRSLHVGREDDVGAPPVHQLESPTSEQRGLVPGPVFDDSKGGAVTEFGQLAGTSTRSPRERRWSLLWLTLGAGAVIAVATAVWLLDRAEYFWQNPLADAQFRLVTDFEGTEQAGAISRDGKFIAFLSDRDGPVDLWVTQVGTGQFHNLTHGTIREPVFLNQRTLLYLATTADGSRAAIYALDLERRIPHRVSFGLEEYTSLAASADGRRLVATVANTKGTLWRVPISDHVAEESAASPITLPTAGGLSPRQGANYLLYVSSRSGSEGIWKLAAGTATALWTAPNARIVGGPSIAPDGRGITFVVEEQGRTRLYVMDDDGTNVRTLTESMELRGAPAWAPDGESIVSFRQACMN